MLLKLYLMFHSKWFLEKIGHQGAGEHGQVLILSLFFPRLCSSTSSPSPPHCAHSPPHPLLPPTVLIHLLTLFFPPLCLFTSSPSSSPHCARSPTHPLLPPTVLVHLLTLFFLPLCSSTSSPSSSPPLCSSTSSPSSSPHCARPPPHPLLPPTVLIHLLTLFFPPLFV